MYDVRLTRACLKRLKKIYSKSKAAQHLVEKRLDDLRNDPYAGSYFLVGATLKGKRALHAGKLRIVFAICEECRELEHTRFNDCYDCDEIPDNTIVVFTVDSHDRAYSYE